jgi:hypothetical protein
MSYRRETIVGPAFQWVAVGAIGVVAAWKLLTHRSTDPFVLGYSLSYLALLVFLAGGLAFSIVLFRRFGRKAIYLLLGMAASTAIFLASIELVLHAYAFARPAYDVVFLQPDRFVGWTQVPNLRWRWTGTSFAAREFSVPIQTNALGFRDRDHAIARPAGTARIALIGDSFLEALQVPFEETAGALLEAKLNADAGRSGAGHHEVLNFGISNFGVGQYLLLWEHYARRFSPKYVFIFVGGMQMERTVMKMEAGGFQRTVGRQLWVRPIYRLEGDRLVLERARDFDAFVEVQNALVADEFGPDRMRRRRVGFLIGGFPRLINERLNALQGRFEAGGRPRPERFVAPGVVRVNLKVLEELDRSVERAGGRLVLLDVVRYNWGPRSLSDTLRAFCARGGIGYIALSDDLLARERSGVPTRWRFDRHFGPEGNRVLADAMARWIALDRERRGSRGPGA